MGIEAVYQERALCDQQELYRNIFAGREITNFFGFWGAFFSSIFITLLLRVQLLVV